MFGKEVKLDTHCIFSHSMKNMRKKEAHDFMEDILDLRNVF